MRVFEISIKVRLKSDVTPEEATEIVNNMDYSLSHVMIADTEVMGHDAEERCS